VDIIERYKCQRVSQLIHLANRENKSKPFRVENCHRLRTGKAIGVDLKKKPEDLRAHYFGLQTCGSVWVCPVCASYISEARCKQVQESIENWRNRSVCNSVIMVTWTTPHYLHQKLEDVLELQDSAIKNMKNQRERTKKFKTYKSIMSEMCAIGSYTGREVTFGRNGWHPHRHELFFVPVASERNLKVWRIELTLAFMTACEKVGLEIKDLGAFFKRGVCISQVNEDDGYTRIAKYLTTVEGKNWTAAQELTKGNCKGGKNGNITPFGMLNAVMEGSIHSRLYSYKFHEYALAMHGKKQFFPTPGLAKFLRVDHKTDQEIVEDSLQGVDYAKLDLEDWEMILNMNIRGEVLSMTEKSPEEFHFQLDEMLREFEAA
jgi:hypothetical protein